VTTGGVEFAVFTAAVAVRHIFQLCYRLRRMRGGEASGYISTAILFLCYVSVWVAASVFILRGVPRGILFACGAGVFALAIAMRLAAIATLGAYYSEAIEIRGDHRLVRSGMYSVVRHPLHLAFFGELLGMAMMGRSLWLAAPLAVLFVTLAVRNRTEDGKLEEKFGDEFRAYANRVPAVNLIAGLFRLIRNRKSNLENRKF